MRLGFDLLFLIPEETGGRETYARELIRALMAVAGDQLEPTAFVGREDTAAWVRDLDLGIRAVLVPADAGNGPRWAAGELLRLSGAGSRRGIEVMHSLANFGPLTGPSARVLTLHDLQYRAVPELLSPARRAGTAVLVAGAARRAHRVITVSAASRDEITSELGVLPDRIDVIPNGTQPGDLTGAPSEARLRETLAVGARQLVVTVATALPHKNLSRLLEALVMIEPNRRPVLVLAGAGTDGEPLIRQVAELGLGEDVRLLGFASAPMLERLYASAGCVVVPSLYEGFGLPAIDAMARGVPVACSDLPALREVTGGAAVHFDPHRPAAIADAILGLLGDANRASALADQGRAQAARFTWERAARATLESYRRARAAAR